LKRETVLPGAMKGILLVFVASIVALATGQDCPAYYVRSQSGDSCYRYFNLRVPYAMASEFCEMVTPCGNGVSKMGALASVGSAQENFEIYNIVAGFSQDNQMETEIWLGWNSQNPYNWEDGTPAYPNGFSAFTSGGARPQRPGAPASRTWPVNAQSPFAPPPGSAPCMRRQNPGGQPGQGGQPPQGVGPLWDLVAVTQRRGFVCEVAAGRNNPAPVDPAYGGQQPPQRGPQGGPRGGFGGGPQGGPQGGPRGGPQGGPQGGNPRYNPRPRLLQENEVYA